MMFRDKRVILGVTGSIAAYKTVELLRLLRKEGANIQVIMSEGAKNFVSPLTFKTLSGNDVLEKQFDDMKHISLGKADALVIAPATANFIAKASVGLADDLLTSTLQAFSGPVIIAPAMNDVMYDNQISRKNVHRLRTLGYEVVEPDKGELACGKKGRGRLAELEKIVEALESAFSPKDLEGKTVLVTAGPTREYLDPVRYITNESSGKMGFAFAHAAKARGAKVVLVTGPTKEKPPAGVKTINVTTTREMFGAARKEFKKADIFISAAAPSDFTAKKNRDKIKKTETLKLKLEKTPDILEWCGKNKRNQFVLGFALETKPGEGEAKRKMKEKSLDAILLNTPKNFNCSEAEGVLLQGRKKKKIRKQNKLFFANEVLTEALQNA